MKVGIIGVGNMGGSLASALIESGYEVWLQGISQVARQFEGHNGVTILRPQAGTRKEYVIILRFDKYKNLCNWMRSSERQEWIERAKNLMQDRNEKKDMVDIVISAAKGLLEILDNMGNLPVSHIASVAPVRSNADIESANIIALSKTFDDEIAEVQIERVRDNFLNLKVMIKGISSDTPLEGIRVSLFNPDRELASYIAKNGEAYFKELSIGKYIVKISKSGQEIGELSLVIKE